MQLKIYSCFDRVSQSYSEPFVAVNDPVAIRRFNYVLSQSAMVAEDIQLFCLGEFETDSGAISPNVQFVCNYTKPKAEE